MGPDIWAALGPSVAAPPPQTRCHVAPGGSVFDHAWPAPLLMAGRGSGRPHQYRPPPAREDGGAEQCFRKLLQGGQYVPRVRITEQLRRDGAATRERWPGVEPRQPRSWNNRAEHAHHPTRPRERRRQGCKSPGHAPRFLAAYGPSAQNFRPRRPRWSAAAYRQAMRHRCDPWQDRTNLPTAAEGARPKAVIPLLGS